MLRIAFKAEIQMNEKNRFFYFQSNKKETWEAMMDCVGPSPKMKLCAVSSEKLQNIVKGISTKQQMKDHLIGGQCVL